MASHGDRIPIHICLVRNPVLAPLQGCLRFRLSVTCLLVWLLTAAAFSDLLSFTIKRNPILVAVILFPMQPRDGIRYNEDNHFPVSPLI